MTDIVSPLKSLREGLAEEESVFILLDGAMLPAMQRVYGYETSPQACPVYYGTRHEAALDVSPCLYQPSIKSQVWMSSNEWREYGVVFTSQEGFQNVLKHLQGMISVTLPSGQLAYWRFYSPDWFLSVMDALNQEELNKFTGPISKWLVFTGREWRAYQPAAVKGKYIEKEEGWLHISNEILAKWQEDMKGSFVRQHANQAREKGVKLPSDASYESEVSRLFDIAKGSGFTRGTDIERFIWLALKHPVVRSSEKYRAVIDNESYLPVRRVDKIEAMLYGIQEDEGL